MCLIELYVHLTVYATLICLFIFMEERVMKRAITQKLLKFEDTLESGHLRGSALPLTRQHNTFWGNCKPILPYLIYVLFSIGHKVLTVIASSLLALCGTFGYYTFVFYIFMIVFGLVCGFSMLVTIFFFL